MFQRWEEWPRNSCSKLSLSSSLSFPLSSAQNGHHVFLRQTNVSTCFNNKKQPNASFKFDCRILFSWKATKNLQTRCFASWPILLKMLHLLTHPSGLQQYEHCSAKSCLANCDLPRIWPLWVFPEVPAVVPWQSGRGRWPLLCLKWKSASKARKQHARHPISSGSPLRSWRTRRLSQPYYPVTNFHLISPLGCEFAKMWKKICDLRIAWVSHRWPLQELETVQHPTEAPALGLDGHGLLGLFGDKSSLQTAKLKSQLATVSSILHQAGKKDKSLKKKKKIHANLSCPESESCFMVLAATWGKVNLLTLCEISHMIKDVQLWMQTIHISKVSTPFLFWGSCLDMCRYPWPLRASPCWPRCSNPSSLPMLTTHKKSICQLADDVWAKVCGLLILFALVCEASMTRGWCVWVVAVPWKLPCKRLSHFHFTSRASVFICQVTCCPWPRLAHQSEQLPQVGPICRNFRKSGRTLNSLKHKSFSFIFIACPWHFESIYYSERPAAQSANILETLHFEASRHQDPKDPQKARCSVPLPHQPWNH